MSGQRSHRRRGGGTGSPGLGFARASAWLFGLAIAAVLSTSFAAGEARAQAAASPERAPKDRFDVVAKDRSAGFTGHRREARINRQRIAWHQFHSFA